MGLDFLKRMRIMEKIEESDILKVRISHSKKKQNKNIKEIPDTFN